MGSFANDLKKFREKTEKTAELVCTKIIFDLYRRVVRRSPVDTGRFRANNQISLNDLPSTSVFEFKKNQAVTIRDGEAVLASFSLGDTAFIYNNVAYALALEYGSSKQAPQGMYRISYQELLTHLKGVIRRATE